MVLDVCGFLAASEVCGEWPYMRGGHQLCIDCDSGKCLCSASVRTCVLACVVK